MKRYILNILISIDQFFNTILGGNPDETMSSRMGRNMDTCLICNFICKCLNLIQKDHCKKSIEKDENA